MPQDEQQLQGIVAEVVRLPYVAGLQGLSRWGSPFLSASAAVEVPYTACLCQPQAACQHHAQCSTVPVDKLRVVQAELQP